MSERTTTEKTAARGLLVVTHIVVSGVVGLLQAWPVMLAAGVLHGYWPAVPAFGYWQSVALTWAWGTVWTVMGRELKVEFR